MCHPALQFSFTDFCNLTTINLCMMYHATLLPTSDYDYLSTYLPARHASRTPEPRPKPQHQPRKLKQSSKSRLRKENEHFKKGKRNLSFILEGGRVVSLLYHLYNYYILLLHTSNLPTVLVSSCSVSYIRTYIT